VVTDSVFSMDGDLAPLPDLVEVCGRHGAVLMVDEAHATGVVGPGGRGAVAHFGLEGRVPVVMGTLSKSLGAAGGFIAGSEELCGFLRHRARSFVFDTALPPPTAAAALTALGILEREPERAERVRWLARCMAEGLAEIGYPVPRPEAAVIPVVVGEPATALELAGGLLERGVLAVAIRPPSVPEGTSRLRVTVMATHTDAHLDLALEAFRALR
jgi:7-keto-8-aminopelargonate synthetase and related enzymes